MSWSDHLRPMAKILPHAKGCPEGLRYRPQHGRASGPNPSPVEREVNCLRCRLAPASEPERAVTITPSVPYPESTATAPEVRPPGSTAVAGRKDTYPLVFTMVTRLRSDRIRGRLDDPPGMGAAAGRGDRYCRSRTISTLSDGRTSGLGNSHARQRGLLHSAAIRSGDGRGIIRLDLTRSPRLV